MPTWLFEAEVVAHRGLRPAALGAVRRLEDAGVRCCNPVAAEIAVKDRVLCSRRLAEAGVPVPRTARFETWPAVLDGAAGRQVVVKAADGSRGRSAGVILAEAGDLPERAPFAGPYIVQQHIPNDGWDRKVYVAGRVATGVLKRWPPRGTADRLGEPFNPDAELVRLSRLVGEALDLEVYGADFVEGPSGPAVVDVNSFPGFKGVPGAARLIAAHLFGAAAMDGEATPAVP